MAAVHSSKELQQVAVQAILITGVPDQRHEQVLPVRHLPAPITDRLAHELQLIPILAAAGAVQAVLVLHHRGIDEGVTHQ